VTLALKNTGFLPDINSGHNVELNGSQRFGRRCLWLNRL
jgi:hypothetical protein